MGGATVFPRHIFHMHHNYSDTMAALQTSPYLTCLFFYCGVKKRRHNSWKTLPVNYGVNPTQHFYIDTFINRRGGWAQAAK